MTKAMGIYALPAILPETQFACLNVASELNAELSAISFPAISFPLSSNNHRVSLSPGTEDASMVFALECSRFLTPALHGSEGDTRTTTRRACVIPSAPPTQALEESLP